MESIVTAAAIVLGFGGLAFTMSRLSRGLRKDIKADFSEFRGEMKQDFKDFKSEVKADFKEFKAEVKADIAGLRIEMKQNFRELRVDHRLLRGRFDRLTDSLAVRGIVAAKPAQ